jgi:hypothetical protein
MDLHTLEFVPVVSAVHFLFFTPTLILWPIQSAQERNYLADWRDMSSSVQRCIDTHVHLMAVVDGLFWPFSVVIRLFLHNQ